MSKMLFVLLVVTGLQVVRVASLDLTISPGHVRVTWATQSVSFTCSADVALAGCQFRWWDGRYNKAGPLLELSRGSQSQADPAHLSDELTGYSYNGRGLEAGDCGVSLQVWHYKSWMVACRVRAESGGWKYAWTDLYASNLDPLPHNRTTPREVVVLPAKEARFMLEAGEPLGGCWFDVPGGSDLVFHQGAASAHSTIRHGYLGAGLQSGECGLALSDITEADNGPVRCFFSTPRSKGDSRYSALIVARPPTEPTLSLVYTGNNVTATCEVQESRPVANMSWVLGDAVIHHGVTVEATAQDEWRWPWMKGSIKQTLTLQLQPQGHGQVLACIVSHVALVQPQEAKKVISFERPTIATTTRTTSSTAHMTAPSTTVSHAPGPNCLATNYLDLLCQEYRVRPTEHGNTSCPKDDVHEYRIREAEAAARTAELEKEAAKVKLEAAKSSAQSEEARATASQLEVEAAQSRAKAEEARAREQEALALNAEEGLQFERERRTKSRQHSQ